MTDELKTLMKDQLNLIRDEIKEYTKSMKDTRIGSTDYLKRQREIERLEDITKFYMVGKTKPVRVNGEIIVNSILLNQILKKVGSYEIEISDNELIIGYRTYKGEGKFTLNDLSKYYSTWPIPETFLTGN